MIPLGKIALSSLHDRGAKSISSLQTVLQNKFADKKISIQPIALSPLQMGLLKSIPVFLMDTWISLQKCRILGILLMGKKSILPEVDSGSSPMEILLFRWRTLMPPSRTEILSWWNNPIRYSVHSMFWKGMWAWLQGAILILFLQARRSWYQNPISLMLELPLIPSHDRSMIVSGKILFLS